MLTIENVLPIMRLEMLIMVQKISKKANNCTKNCDLPNHSKSWSQPQKKIGQQSIINAEIIVSEKIKLFFFLVSPPWGVGQAGREKKKKKIFQ